jgi:Mitochondrial genome maintenance MGM101
MVFHHFIGFGAARFPFRALSTIRTYVAVGGRSYVLPRPSPAKQTTLAGQVSTTRTNATKGNPEIVDSYPTTANEIEADVATQSEIVNNAPAESIPSSGALSLPPLLDGPPTGGTTDWSRSYHGLSTQPFPPEVAEILQAAIDPLDIEMKPGPSPEGMS